MLDGLDQDDIYIMVEDEFHTIARTFTQHLHHAEYVRLKNLARSRNASTASKISRPVDSITAIRAETKKKKEAELREAKNKTALEQLKSTARARILSSEDSDLSEPEDKDEGHWKGTPLQGLMTTSPHKNHTSLTGLQSIKSTTRAAAGFSKSGAKPSSYPSAKPYDLAPKPPPTQRKPRPPTPSTSSDDDLDAPITKRPPAMPAPAPRPPPPLAKPPTRKPASTPIPEKKPHSKHNPSRSVSQESPGRPSVIETATARRRLKTRMAREEMEKGKKARVEVDEIPVFLY